MPATKQIKEIETPKSKQKITSPASDIILSHCQLGKKKNINLFLQYRIEKKKIARKRVDRIGNCSPEQNKLSKNDITSNLSLAWALFLINY